MSPAAKRRFAALLAAAVTASPAAAQLAPTPNTTLTLAVDAEVSRAPDLVEVSGGVITSSATATAAMAENAAKMTAVVAALRKAGVADRDVQTASLSLQPQYKYANNEAPQLVGYQASNTVNVRLRKPDEVGRILDTLVSVGANRIDGPNFRVENADAALDEARTRAVAKGRARAELYAKAAGLRVKRIVAISEQTREDPRPRPMMMASAKMEADSTPVAAGEVQLAISLAMVFELE